MVRRVAERAFIPTQHLLEEFGDMMILAGRTIVSALRPPYPYGGELVSQFLFTLRLAWFPLLITTVALNLARSQMRRWRCERRASAAIRMPSRLPSPQRCASSGRPLRTRRRKRRCCHPRSAGPGRG